MNTTNAAMPRKISVVGFTSENPNIPADMVPISGVTLPLGDTPAPPETLTLTDGEPGAADGVPNVSGVSGVGFANDTGSLVVETGIAVTVGFTGDGAERIGRGRIPPVHCVMGDGFGEGVGVTVVVLKYVCSGVRVVVNGVRGTPNVGG